MLGGGGCCCQEGLGADVVVTVLTVGVGFRGWCWCRSLEQVWESLMQHRWCTVGPYQIGVDLLVSYSNQQSALATNVNFSNSTVFPRSSKKRCSRALPLPSLPFRLCLSVPPSLPPPHSHHHLTSPHLTSPHLTSPHLTSPHLTSPHLTSHISLPLPPPRPPTSHFSPPSLPRTLSQPRSKQSPAQQQETAIEHQHDDSQQVVRNHARKAKPTKSTVKETLVKRIKSF